jgi:hypothetical protein
MPRHSGSRPSQTPPGDDWVDIAEATNLGAALSAAFPEIDVITSTDGTCATGQHNAPLIQTGLADCIIDFVAARFPLPPSPPTVPLLSAAGMALWSSVLVITIVAVFRRS